MSKRSIPELSIDTQTLERALLTVAVGEVVGYESLSKLIGRNVQNGATHLLQSARRRVQRDHHIVFEPVRGEGLKRLDDEGKARSGESALAKIRSTARRGQEKLLCVDDFDSLSNDAKIKHNLSLSVLGALRQVAKATTMKRLEGKVSNSKHDALPVAKFLDAARESL